MKKIILSLSAAVFALCLASSCDDDENVVLSSDCYINSLTLGNVKRVISTVGSSGNDTTYTLSYSGLYYPMIVNQLEGTIANKDSLPVNSDVRAVLATVESSGTVVYRKESEGEDSWHSYSTSDSIDFTTPLIFRVYAPDNSASRDYRVQVNVHQQDGEVFVWEKMAEQQPWAAAEALKAVYAVLNPLGGEAEGVLKHAGHPPQDVEARSVAKLHGTDGIVHVKASPGTRMRAILQSST